MVGVTGNPNILIFCGWAPFRALRHLDLHGDLVRVGYFMVDNSIISLTRVTFRL